MSRPAIALELQRSDVAPGEQVTGHVKVIQPGSARKLAVTLRLRDRTPDYVGTSRTADTQTLAGGELAAGAELPFSMQLPPDAPPTYSAGGAAVWWEVQASCDVLGPDVSATARLEVKPAA